MKIPKTIYQTWSTQNLPSKLKKLHNKMLKNNPGYQHIIYTNSQMNDYMNANADKEIREAYWKMNHIVAKADIWRYTILLQNGGVYLDIDSEITSSLSSLIQENDEAIISPEIHENLFIQWGLIFNKDHKILEKTLNNILSDIKNGNNQFDHHALTVQNYAKAIFDFCLDNEITFSWSEPSIQNDITFKSANSSFRVVGNDYKYTFSFKHKFNHLIRERPKGTPDEFHWSKYKGPIYS